MSEAKKLYGDQGLKSFRLKSKFGFGWKKGAAENEAGHSLDFEFECLPVATPPVIVCAATSRAKCDRSGLSRLFALPKLPSRCSHCRKRFPSPNRTQFIREEGGRSARPNSSCARSCITETRKL
jgi:hypothetical protein